MTKVRIFALFAAIFFVSIGGGLLGGYLRGSVPQPASPPVDDLPIEEVARRAKDLVVKEMRESLRERLSEARDWHQAPDKNASALQLVEIEDFGSFRRELEENEVAFFAKYGDKRVRIAGAFVNKVELAWKGMKYAAEVEMKVPASLYGILKCRVNSDQLDAISKLKEGQEVVVVGVPTQGGAFPTLSDCMITLVEK